MQSETQQNHDTPQVENQTLGGRHGAQLLTCLPHHVQKEFPEEYLKG